MILASVLLLLSSLSAVAQDDPPPQMGISGDAILKMLNPHTETCDTCAGAATYALRKPNKNFYKDTPCSEILSTHPPSDLVNSMSALDKVDGEWWPVCSLSFLNDAREKKLNPSLFSAFSVSASTEKVAENFANRDDCARKASTMRGADHYLAPTQKKEHFTVMNSDQIKAYLSQVAVVQARVTDQCCSSNPAIESDCRQAMGTIKVVLCKPVTDPKKPDPCSEDDTYFQASQDAGQLGEVDLSPFLKDGLAHDDSFTINHEFGHACSQALRNISATASSDFEKVNDNRYQDTPGKPTVDCDLTPEYMSVYTSLFHRFGVGDDSVGCLINGATALKNKRFQTGACLGGCPVAGIEESFANTVALASAEHFDAKIIDWGVCHGTRDNEHLLVMDDLRCDLRSSGFAEKLETGLGCRK
jgi:hypothetical protein